MNRTILVTGIVFGGLAVALGAFAAHGLEALLEPDQIETFETGVRYQMYHALLLLLVGGLQQIPAPQKKWVYWSLTAGILLFSFSIYALATNTLTAFDFKVIGFITPLGGVLLILGWVVFALRVMRYVK